MGWLSSKSAPPPPAPDYKGAAEATAASSQQAQTQADWANRPTINTPWGTESWQAAAGVDPATGKPITQWTQNTVLDPQAQATLDAQQAGDLAKAQIAQGQLGRIGTTFGQQFDTSGMQALGATPQAGNLQAGQGIMAGLNMASLGAMPQADAAERQRIENAMFERMRPEHQQMQQGLETKLQNMGLTRGTPQFNRELQRLQDQQSRERFNALEAGGREMERMFGMGMQGRQQGFNELLGAGQFQNEAQALGFGQQATAGAQNFQQQMSQSAYQNQLRQQQMAEAERERTRPLNEYNALMTGTQVGQLATPDFNASKSAGGANYLGAADLQGQDAMEAYNAQQRNKQGLMSGLTGLGSAAITVF